MSSYHLVSDSALVEWLEEKLGIPLEDGYELIDGFAAPQPPAIRGIRILRVEDKLEIRGKDTWILEESAEPYYKWRFAPR